MANLKAVSLYSGCGGMDRGLHGGFYYLDNWYPRIPIETVAALDNDPYACDIYDANHQVTSTRADIREVSASEIPPHHILTGGFPCQPYSIVAQNPPRLGLDDEKNGGLVLEMCRILKFRKPMVFVAENVKGILTANKRMAFPAILHAFEEAGYYVTYQVLDSSDFGVPQKRERVFIVGFRRKDIYDNFMFPTPVTKLGKVPLRLALEAPDDIDDKYWFSAKAVAGMERVRDKMNKGRVQDLEGPCNTVSAHLAKVSLNSVDPVLNISNRYRRFTPKEVSRIQAFPDDFRLIGSDTRLYRALGNAVSPVVMWHLGRQILKAIRKTSSRLLNEQPHRTAKEKRSYNMSMVKSKDTQPELKLRRELWKRGYRYRTHSKALPGTPDIVFGTKKVAIFCDSEFWHGRFFQETASRIRTNKDYWESKIRNNMERDLKVTSALKNRGWDVIRIWDSDIRDDLTCVLNKIVYALQKKPKYPNHSII